MYINNYSIILSAFLRSLMLSFYATKTRGILNALYQLLKL